MAFFGVIYVNAIKFNYKRRKDYRTQDSITTRYAIDVWESLTFFFPSNVVALWLLCCGCISQSSLLYPRVGFKSEWIRTTGCCLTSKPVAYRYFQSIHATKIGSKPGMSWCLQVFNSRKLYSPISL